MNQGKIELIIGPVNSGKTTELIRLSRRYFIQNLKILFLKFSDAENIEEIPCTVHNSYNLLKLENIILHNCKLLMDSDIILIDDLHFFPDCLEYIPMFANKYNKTIIAAGLDCNFNRKPFENIISLVPKCDSVVKLTAFCDILKDETRGIFSHKESDEKYLSLSRKKYLEINNIKHNSKVGKFILIVGPMFSGKSTELIRRGSQYKMIGKNILAINHSIDKRYDDGNICSHDKNCITQTVSINNLEIIEKVYLEKLNKSEVILIDELQFFKDADIFVKKMVEEYGKIVIASGLDGDFLQRQFGDVCKLIPFSDEFVKLKSICLLSGGKEASFTRRISDESKQNIVGSNDKYISCSREVYFLPDSNFNELNN